MLISDSHKFIFVHVYKNAGTSITSALMPFATSRLQGRLAVLSNYPILRRIPRIVARFERFDATPFHPHVSAQQIYTEFGAEVYKTYFSFAIVRNPWDWQVSLYNYMLKTTTHHQHSFIKDLGSFDEYIRWRCIEEVRFQKDFICSEQGAILVDYVGKFEQIDTDFQNICSRIGTSVTLPKKNVSNTTCYKEFYNNETEGLVRKVFEPDIDMFKYSF